MGEPIERVPRIAVLTGAVDQSVWVAARARLHRRPGVDGHDQHGGDRSAGQLRRHLQRRQQLPGRTPANATGRARLAAFFAGGGGYIGGQTAGANFLAAGAQVDRASRRANRAGNGRSGIIYWDNTGGAGSIITGAYPARDTAIVDPPTWLTAVPSSFAVDGRLPATNFFAAGLWPIAGDPQSATAPGSAVIAHGPNTADTARLAVFANNPLYRADPEREWPMLGSAVYWADK